MRKSSEDFITNPDDIKLIERTLQAAIQGELAIIEEDKELIIKECDGFELAISLDSLKVQDIYNSVAESYDEYSFDDGESLKISFLEDNDDFSEDEVDELINMLAYDLETMKFELAELVEYSGSKYQTAV